MNADGSGQRPLSAQGFAWLSGLEWSPDGRQLAFSAFDDATRLCHIFVMNSDGSNLRDLTTGAAGEVEYFEPAWSPDGRQLAVRRTEFGAGTAIALVNADGSNLRAVFSDSEYKGTPSWMPDGRQLLFHYNFDIYRMNVDGSDLTPLTDDPNWDIEPAWLPPPSGQVVAEPGGVATGPQRLYLHDDFSTNQAGWSSDQNDDGSTWGPRDGQYVVDLKAGPTGGYREVIARPEERGAPRLRDADGAYEISLEVQVLEHQAGTAETIEVIFNYRYSNQPGPKSFRIFADGTWSGSYWTNIVARRFETLAEGPMPPGLDIFDGNPHHLLVWVSSAYHRLLVDGHEVGSFQSRGLDGTLVFSVATYGPGSRLQVAFDNFTVQSPHLVVQALGEQALAEALPPPAPYTTVFADPAVFSGSVQVSLRELFNRNFGPVVALWQVQTSTP